MISQEKRERLSTFLGSLPNATALKLFAALEFERLFGKGGLPHEDLLTDLRGQLLRRNATLPPRKPDARRIFFTPVEDFIIAQRCGHKKTGRLCRSSFTPIWNILTSDPACEEIAKAADALNACLAGACLAGARLERDGGDRSEREMALYSSSVPAMSKLVERARVDADFRSDLIDRLGDENAFADFEEIAFLLGRVEYLTALQKAAAKPADGLSEEELFEIRRLFFVVQDEAPEFGSYFLLALMGRMEARWAALGFYYHLLRACDEEADAARETIAIIPQTLFDELEDLVRGLSRDAEGAFHADAARIQIAHFADFAQGLTVEAQKADDNVILNRLEACRDVAGEAFARFLEQSLAELRTALPVRPAGGSSRLMAFRPDFNLVPSAAQTESAQMASSFLADADDLAQRLQRDGSASALKGEATERASAYVEDLVKEIRAAEGKDRLAARRLMDHALAVCSPLMADEDIALLHDRAMAAACAY